LGLHPVAPIEVGQSEARHRAARRGPVAETAVEADELRVFRELLVGHPALVRVLLLAPELGFELPGPEPAGVGLLPGERREKAANGRQGPDRSQKDASGQAGLSLPHSGEARQASVIPAETVQSGLGHKSNRRAIRDEHPSIRLRCG
jgi:hypothetical protein